MSVAPLQDRLQVPASLQAQLLDFRRRVWTIKMVEAVSIAVVSLFLAFLTVFVLDRFWDTPAALRFGIFIAAACGWAIIPVFLHRWIWRHRHLEQLARLLSRKLALGDQLLGVIELARSDTEQARSRTLCAAAIQQVAESAQRRDFTKATPNSRHQLWSRLAVASIACALLLLAVVPAAASNAWARFLAPWSDTPRYTFAALESLPARMVVAHGEPFVVSAQLTPDSKWQPDRGQVQLGQQRPITAQLKEGKYEFKLPAQIDPGALHVRIGDSRHTVAIAPTMRPELSSITAKISLPEYLGLPKPVNKDVRGGSLSMLKGSRAKFDATASRKLSAATFNGQPQQPTDSTISSPELLVDESQTVEFRWQDEFGLAGKVPFELSITAQDDQPPTLFCDGLSRQKVVLHSEQLSFHVHAQDDFGIKQIGMEWSGFDTTIIAKPAKGERILAAGGYDQATLDVPGTFSAQTLNIEPQPIELRIFADDYMPSCCRVYSPTFILYVLSAEDHAVWITEMLSKWHRQSLEVRDRELQLFETNKQLRNLTTEELDDAETRLQIERQASAERSNGRRLSQLTANGEDLVKQASRNPEMGVGHLEKWAEMLQILKDISGNRMPSVADLLKDAAQSESMAAAASGSENKDDKSESMGGAASKDKKAPMAGEIRATGSGGAPSEPDKDAKEKPAIPKIVDVESSQQPPDDKAKEQQASKSGGQPSLGLPTTTLIGGGLPSDEACPAGDKMEEAVTEQKELLAEFEKIIDELNTVLANLEGSTLLKRLKAASREQYQIAGRIIDQVDHAFGKNPLKIPPERKDALQDLSTVEAKSSESVSWIIDDMQSYFERRRFMQFKTVLEEMKELDVVGSLRQLGDAIPIEQGVSIAQCEFWSDTLDRWAEDLVEPASGGT